MACRRGFEEDKARAKAVFAGRDVFFEKQLLAVGALQISIVLKRGRLCYC